MLACSGAARHPRLAPTAVLASRQIVAVNQACRHSDASPKLARDGSVTADSENWFRGNGGLGGDERAALEQRSRRFVPGLWPMAERYAFVLAFHIAGKRGGPRAREGASCKTATKTRNTGGGLRP
jgi:hypothetical protein